MKKTEIAGRRYRPNILVLSGIHGNELTSIYTSYLLAEKDWSNYSDNFRYLTILGPINKSGLEANTREINNNSTNDINRMFPSGEQFDFDYLADEINSHDVVIDLHSSPFCTEFVLLNQDLATNSYVYFCLKNRITYAIRYSNQDTIKRYCINNKKTSFTLELNQTSYIDFSSATRGAEIVEKIVNNVCDFEIYNNEPEFSPLINLRTYHSGLFIRNTKPGDIIPKEDVIGNVINTETSKRNFIINPFEESKIITFSDSDYIHPGKDVCLLQPINDVFV